MKPSAVEPRSPVRNTLGRSWWLPWQGSQFALLYLLGLYLEASGLAKPCEAIPRQWTPNLTCAVVNPCCKRLNHSGTQEVESSTTFKLNVYRGSGTMSAPFGNIPFKKWLRTHSPSTQPLRGRQYLTKLI